MNMKSCYIVSPPSGQPPKEKPKTVSGDLKNCHLGCLGYLKEYQTKSFESKILEKATFYAKIKHFFAKFSNCTVHTASKTLENIDKVQGQLKYNCFYPFKLVWMVVLKIKAKKIT